MAGKIPGAAYTIGWEPGVPVNAHKAAQILSLQPSVTALPNVQRIGIL
jgi:hypothetical protein